jgi:hypothetical protein
MTSASQPACLPACACLQRAVPSSVFSLGFSLSVKQVTRTAPVCLADVPTYLPLRRWELSVLALSARGLIKSGTEVVAQADDSEDYRKAADYRKTK